MRWPTDLAVPGSSPALQKFSHRHLSHRPAAEKDVKSHINQPSINPICSLNQALCLEFRRSADLPSPDLIAAVAVIC